MAVCQIHAIKSTMNLALDYIMNPEKTDEKLLVSGFNCEPELADMQFRITKEKAGKTDKRLGYHMMQSFAPGEVSLELAHEIGKRFAAEILGDKFEYVVTTHTDKAHIHNHIIFNSVSFEDHQKFNQPADFYYKIQRESDKLCREYELSVIEQKRGDKSKTHHEHSQTKKGGSWKEKLRVNIDTNIAKAGTWDEFLALMQADNYEVKQGAHIAFRAAEQERFTRAKTLGELYTQESIMARIRGEVIAPKKSVITPAKRKANKLKLLIDIENSVKAKQSAGFKHWATIQNIKMIAQTTNYISDHGLANYGILSAKHKETTVKRDTSLSEIKTCEARINELKNQINLISEYRKNKPIVDKLTDKVFKEKYKNEHAQEFELFENAKKELYAIFGEPKDGGKLPKIADLRTELNRVYEEKNALYTEYNSARGELKELDVVKRNVEKILRREEPSTPQISPAVPPPALRQNLTRDDVEL